MVVPVGQEGFKLLNHFDHSTVRCSKQTMNSDLAPKLTLKKTQWQKFRQGFGAKRHDDRPGYEVQQNGHNGHEGIPKKGA